MSRTLEFRTLWRQLLHGAAVGLAVGVVCCAFYSALVWVEFLCLDQLAGYMPLRPAGEIEFQPPGWGAASFRPWLLLIVPTLGALAAGIVGHFLAPEALGGGGDAFIRAFHRTQANIRKRVAPVKILTSVLTLGSGGSGGREGPTMHIGAAVGSLVGQALEVTPRERRVLLLAGTAGGMAAVFHTPLGAALLAVEVLYRDDFEADALVPAILASVTAYSTFVTIYPGAGPLFAHAPRYPFEPARLPLYIAMAVVLSMAGLLFVRGLHKAHHLFDAVKLPRWSRPALGGLLLGALALAWIYAVNPLVHLAGHGAGILGSGYGAAQGAIIGAAWLPAGWRGVELLAGLALVKMIATSFTIGSGGSAGDFGPSLAIGGLLGGAFGRAAQLLFDPSLDPGAFALVGMGTFYGGLAHAPLSSAVMVCEMAGTYDLLMPLLLAEGVAFIVLRHTTLYPSQVPSRFDSPAHAHESTLDVLKELRAGATVVRDRVVTTIAPGASAADVVRMLAGASPGQHAFPVVDSEGRFTGILAGDTIRALVGEDGLDRVVIVADLMAPPTAVRLDDDLHQVLEKILESGLRALPVLGEDGAIIGVLDESDIARAYHLDIVRRRDGGADDTAGRRAVN